MNLKECYAALEGDYEEVTARLGSERLVQKFIFKFLNDTSYDTLLKALEEGNYNEAFRAAHTIKGICQNLSFTKLGSSSSCLTEALRSGETKDCGEFVASVKEDYMQTYAAIKKLQTENEGI